MPEMLAGWSKHRIPLPRGYGMAGYLARKHSSSGVLDPLYVRALLLRHKSTDSIILLADVLLISSSFCSVLRQRIAETLKIPPASVTLAATHTHSGPLVDTEPFDFSGADKDPRLAKFQHQLELTFLKAARSASRGLQPVRVVFRRARIRNVATDRNRPRSARTQPFLLFQFESSRGSAALAIYGCHPTVLGARNLLYSGDLHGRIASQLEQTVDVALVANGAAGNISTRFTRRGQSSAELSRLARSLVKQVKNSVSIPFADCRLASRGEVLRLPLRSLHALALPASLSRRKGRLRTVAREAEIVRSRLIQSSLFRARSVAVWTSLLRIGPVTLVCLPLELFSSTGELLWKAMRISPLCYANGYLGYLPDASSRAGDYEVISSPFPASADTKLRRAIVALAKSVAR